MNEHVGSDPAGDCPSPNELAAFSAGRLPRARLEQIGKHLAVCSRCLERIAEYDGQSDELAVELRAFHEVEAAVGDDVERLQAFAEVAETERIGTSIAISGDLGSIRDYHLLVKLGEGGMGTVYKVRHTKLDTIVAVKVLRKAHLQEPRAVARFEQEMKAVGKIRHPNIVQAFDAGEEDGTHYLVMEYVDAIDLIAAVLCHGRLPISGGMCAGSASGRWAADCSRSGAGTSRRQTIEPDASAPPAK